MSLATFRIEALREEHIAQILAIEKVANTSPWSERSFRNELDHPHGIFVVGLINGQVVAYGGVWLVIDEAHITTVAVAEDARRQGIGRRLMTDLLNKSIARGATCATLEVRASNEPAITLYQKLGFRTVARRRGYYPDNQEDAVVMWLYELEGWNPA